MSHDILEPAAFMSLGIAASALFVRLGGLRWRKQLRVVRFRRKLRGLDQVVSTWEQEMASGQPARELIRQPRRNRRDRRRPQS